MSKGRIKHSSLKKGNEKIKTPPLSHKDINFSFKYMDFTTKNFNPSEQGADTAYFIKLLERLRDMGKRSMRELRQQGSKALRFHPIQWEKTTEKRGFSCLNEQLQAREAFQFSITGNEHGRVHGFVIDDTFYVVWLDKNHLLYEGKP